ncbi:hypothetical protein BSLG_010445 [Batrachochytrium salamandrivorans]|nr:hypothetical protein BSLG_010445 [Batrachochytrium salamandrivorans]
MSSIDVAPLSAGSHTSSTLSSNPISAGGSVGSSLRIQPASIPISTQSMGRPSITQPQAGQLITMQQLKPGQADTAVMIPQVNHYTVQSILEINKHLIKILVEYQNNGWIGEPEQKIYQQRLQTNLTYLATLADAVQKNRPTISAGLAPDLAPVVYPSKLSNFNAQQARHAAATKAAPVVPAASVSMGPKSESIPCTPSRSASSQGKLPTRKSRLSRDLSESGVRASTTPTAVPTQVIPLKRSVTLDPVLNATVPDVPLANPRTASPGVSSTATHTAAASEPTRPILQPSSQPQPQSTPVTQSYPVTISEINALPPDRDTILDSLAPPVLILDPNHGSSKPDPNTYIPVPPFLGASSDAMTNPTLMLPGFSVLDAPAARDIFRQRLGVPGDLNRGGVKGSMNQIDGEYDYRDDTASALRDGSVYANANPSHLSGSTVHMTNANRDPAGGGDSKVDRGRLPMECVDDAMMASMDGSAGVLAASSATNALGSGSAVIPAHVSTTVIKNDSSNVTSSGAFFPMEDHLSFEIPTQQQQQQQQQSLPTEATLVDAAHSNLLAVGMMPRASSDQNLDLPHVATQSTTGGNENADDEEEDDEDYIPGQDDMEEDEEEEGAYEEDDDGALATNSIEGHGVAKGVNEDARIANASKSDLSLNPTQPVPPLPPFGGSRHEDSLLQIQPQGSDSQQHAQYNYGYSSLVPVSDLHMSLPAVNDRGGSVDAGLGFDSQPDADVLGGHQVVSDAGTGGDLSNDPAPTAFSIATSLSEASHGYHAYGNDSRLG